MRSIRYWAGVLSAFLLLAGGATQAYAPTLVEAPSPSASPAASPASPALTGNQPVQINFPNATLEQIIEFYSNLTGRTAIHGSNLSGRIVIQSNGPLTHEDAIIAIQNVLSANNFSIVHLGEKFFKVVPSPSVRQEGVNVITGDEKLAAADQVMSKIFQLNFAKATDIQASLQPVIHAYGQIMPFPRTNTLLITDTSANLIEIEKIINHLDRPLEATVKSKFYKLKNAKAKDVVARITELLNSSLGNQQAAKQPGVPGMAPGIPGQPEVPPTLMPTPGGASGEFSEEAVVVGKVTLTSDERTNQIILLTRAINFPFFDQMIEKLDADTAAPLILKSIPMKYADAEDMAGLLNQVLGRGGSAGKNKKERVKGEESPSAYNSNPNQRNPPNQPSPPSGLSNASTAAGKEGLGANKREDLVVYADPRTNSLIVMGTAQDIEWVQGFVKDVDVLLAQVLLEGIIVEVTLDRTDSLGVEFLIRAANGQLKQAGLNSTLTINPVDATTIASAATLPTGLASGLNYFATLTSTKMDVLAQALAQISNVKILSQPVIQTSHNEEAKIIVGEARPIVTTTSTDITGNLGNLQSSYEYKDIATELYVRPLVNPDGLVVLDILQKVNSISGEQTINNNQVPIIARREASSVVSVQDGSVIVLGGLISNSETVTKVGIPLLSDIPLIGYLFSNTTKQLVRTELMVLLKPTVLRTPDDASYEARRRRLMLQSFKKQGLDKKLLGERSLDKQLDDIEAQRPPYSIPAEPVPELLDEK